MGEGERVAGLQMRLDLLLVGLGLDLVGDENHDEVGFLGRLLGGHDLQAGFLGLGPGLGALA